MVFNIDAAILQGGGFSHHDYFTNANGNPPSLGQTIFTLSATPSDPARVQALLNGVELAEGALAGNYFTVSGNTLTWNGPPSLSTTDDFEVLY